ncbi:hypothetical protein N8I77_004742 [Diaporthe amygdali]|uniref:Major facilitator superfamily (MFS) profile domain-containing protein n=1 Tax=Phomopsis amygdali TaxID=1214568 RepID=A0AAD9SLZ5_PHOAM|nr:hypothetical protein N8I77_004742 [Diaporthe amygdali]
MADSDRELKESNGNQETSQSKEEILSRADQKPNFKRGPRFWAIISTLYVIGLLSALENTVVTTSLPYIVTELDLGRDYIWVTNVFFLASAAVQPMFGQFANIFGRRYVTLAIVALFTIGSAIAGGASNGINMIVDIIVSDLVPLRERGNYMALVLVVYFVGTALGPYIGGAIVESTSWRWIFYINLPIGGVSMIMIIVFLQVKYNKEMTFAQKVRRIDYIGNALLIVSTVAVLYSLTYGGTLYQWSSGRIIAPLVIGLLGLVAFICFESLNFVIEPVVPPRLFANRTSVTVFAVTLLNSALLYWMLYFLPVYFQTILGSSPARSGVQLLPSIVVAIPAAIVAVILLTKSGKYKPLHLAGFALNTIGLGLFTLLDKDSSTAEWVIFQIIAAGGSGFVLNTLLPACQTPLAESDQAAATATWSFVRSFGNIWGVAIPAAIFNSWFAQLSDRIQDSSIAAQFGHGNAYSHASADFLDTFGSDVKLEIVSVFSDSLKQVWQISIVFSGVSFLLVFLEKQIKMRKDLETEFGIDEGKKVGRSQDSAKAGEQNRLARNNTGEAG